jgi:hypothetical protein
MPDGRIKSMQQYRARYSSSAEYGRYAIGDAVSFVLLLFLDLYQNTENPVALRKCYEALGIAYCRKTSFNPDAFRAKQANDLRRVRLREVHRRIVGQYPPVGDAVSCCFLIPFYPGPG